MCSLCTLMSRSLIYGNPRAQPDSDCRVCPSVALSPLEKTCAMTSQQEETRSMTSQSKISRRLTSHRMQPVRCLLRRSTAGIRAVAEVTSSSYFRRASTFNAIVISIARQSAWLEIHISLCTRHRITVASSE